MSRIKQIKTSSDNNISVFNLISLLVPEKKDKYTETLLRITKKTPQIESYVAEIKERLIRDYEVNPADMIGFTLWEVLFFDKMLQMFDYSDLKSFRKFCELNERGLIKQNDLSRYNDFTQIMNSLNIAEIQVDYKELEKQVKVVYEDDEWLLVRPLTFLSSKKYGSNTKWCTTTEHNPDYFIKYSTKGVLIYCINKKTGYKVASFYSLQPNDPEFSFWNQKDDRVDSLDTDLTHELRKIILDESKSKDSKTNRFLLSDEERIKEDVFLNRGMHKYPTEPVVEERPNYMRRALERAVTEMGEDIVESESLNPPPSEISLFNPHLQTYGTNVGTTISSPYDTNVTT